MYYKQLIVLKLWEFLKMKIPIKGNVKCIYIVEKLFTAQNKTSFYLIIKFYPFVNELRELSKLKFMSKTIKTNAEI